MKSLYGHTESFVYQERLKLKVVYSSITVIPSKLWNGIGLWYKTKLFTLMHCHKGQSRLMRKTDLKMNPFNDTALRVYLYSNVEEVYD